MKKLKLKIKVDSDLPKTKQLESLMLQADELYNSERYNDCIEIYYVAASIDSLDTEIIRRRGITYYKIEKFDAAYEDFQLVYKRHPTNSSVNDYLGNLELRRRNIDQAAKHWLVAKENGNKNSDTSLNRYWNYKDKFLLTKDQVKLKLDMFLGFQNRFLGFQNYDYEFMFEKITYLGDLNEVSFIKPNDKIKTIGYFNRLGIAFNIKFRKDSKILGISYHEILNIDYSQSERIFTLKLSNGESVRFLYDLGKDESELLKRLCKQYTSATGVKTTAGELFDIGS